MKKINESKLQFFQIGSTQERINRKKLEEQKKKEEEEAAANAFKEFVETFQATPAPATAKVWVKAGTYDAGSRKEDTREKGKLYKPTSRLDSEKSALERTQEYAKLLSSETTKKDIGSGKKKGGEKKKSNLELFKEELRQIQEEREERHKYKHIAKTMVQKVHEEDKQQEDKPQKEHGSFDNGDPNTTNLYLGNLNPKISEQELMKLFGKYGPLASIKIMWPRSEEEKSRNRNCGFVAYMSRKDAERALRNLNGIDVMNYEMKMGWGKAVPIMTHPIYIPQPLIDYTMPPPPSGLPFNAQTNGKLQPPQMTSQEYMCDEEKRKEMDEVLSQTIVKVCIPTERPLLMLIHRMIEFVIREGPMFEAIIMNREIDNPMFRFLFENESPAHIYYRWKLFSLLQGDSITEWNEKEFRMFKNGSIWKPPAMNFYTQGMPEELLSEEDLIEPNKGQLSVAQRDRLEDIIRRLTAERKKIADAMIFCIEHAEAADEIAEVICESLCNVSTLPHKKIARLYLVSDVLHNSTVKVQNASFFRMAIENNLVEMFRGLRECHISLESRLKAEGFKVRVMQILRTWEEWAVYSQEFLTKLQNTFLGLPDKPETKEQDEEPPESDEDVDGIPLDGAALLKGALLRTGVSESKSQSPKQMNIYDEDIDGVPLTDDIDGVPLEEEKPVQRAFIPSKWETVDPEQVEAQAVTTSKWDTLPIIAPEPPKIGQSKSESDQSDSDSDSNLGFDDERRTILREIELKTMQYQDDLETGRRSMKSGYTISEQVQHYRKKLIKKVKRKQEESSDSSDSREQQIYREPSPPVISSYSKKSSKRSKRSKSSSYERDYERSNSPKSSRSYKSRSPMTLSRRQDSDSPQSSSHSSSRRYKESRRSRSRSPHSSSERSERRRYDRELSPPVKSSRYESSRDRERYQSSSSSHKKHKRSKY
uniref:CSON005757 protein n=1 Tax=Culicoides sonorensis TaxID=179676 RepID=A0A336N3G9_CULSO